MKRPLRAFVPILAILVALIAPIAARAQTGDNSTLTKIVIQSDSTTNVGYTINKKSGPVTGCLRAQMNDRVDQSYAGITDVTFRWYHWKYPGCSGAQSLPKETHRFYFPRTAYFVHGRSGQDYYISVTH